MSEYRVSLEEMKTILEKAISSFLECQAAGKSSVDEANGVAIARTLEFIGANLRPPSTKSEGAAESPSQATEIFIVEFRQHLSAALDPSSHVSYSAVIAHLASSLEKAANWCKANTNYEEHDSNKVWDFAIRKREIDGDLKGGGLIMILDWDGEVSGWKV